MDLTLTDQTLRVVRRLSSVLGQDATLRQVNTLLHVAMSGLSGTGPSAIEKKTESSQAAVSRNLRLLGVEHGLIEFFLDQADGRRRLVRLAPRGAALLNEIAGEIK